MSHRAVQGTWELELTDLYYVVTDLYYVVTSPCGCTCFEACPTFTALSTFTIVEDLRYLNRMYGAHPALVRKTLKSGPPTFLRGGGGEAATPSPLPSGCGAMCCKLGMITNWSFAHFSEMSISGCTHLLHVPHVDCSMVPFEWCVVYRPRAGQLACAMLTRACGSDHLQDALPLAQAVRVE